MAKILNDNFCRIKKLPLISSKTRNLRDALKYPIKCYNLVVPEKSKNEKSNLRQGLLNIKPKANTII
jgi:hypothetical protein